MQGIVERQPSYIDYPGADFPDHTCVCPRCGRVWEGRCGQSGAFGSEIEWSYGEDDLALMDSDWPIQNDMCRACAWEDHFDQNEMDYVADEVEKRNVIAYCLQGTGCGREGFDFDEDAANHMFDTLANHDKAYMGELIHDYISECKKDDFVDWLIGRGFTSQ